MLSEEYEDRLKNESSKQVSLSEFELFKTLGTGSFGRVVLVKHNETNKYYAMKILDKERIVHKKQIQHTLNEKRILLACRFPFIVGLHYCCKDNSNLYLIMDFVEGGEMFTHLRKIGRFSESIAKFYASQVYNRDLKIK